MRCRVLLFAGLKDALGREFLEVEVPEAEARVADLRRAAEAAAPSLRQERYRVAVASAYAAEEDLVRPGDEVAFLPPVSGG